MLLVLIVRSYVFTISQSALGSRHPNTISIILLYYEYYDMFIVLIFYLGPYIKWFLRAIGPVGIYRMVKDYEDKSVSGVSIIAYVNEQGEVTLFTGEAHGTIVKPTEKPEMLKGWDSCFKPDGYKTTYSLMADEEKNRISERMKSVYKLKKFLDKNVLND